MESMPVDFSVIEELSEIMILFDRTGKILYGNRAAREKLGYTQEELCQCCMPEIFWQEFQQETGTYLPFDREILWEKTETSMYRKNSSCFPVNLHFHTMEDGTDYLLAEDITWNKGMDLKVRQLTEEGELNRKMRNEFTANVTHELRTPVNGIKGHVTNLLDVVTDQEQRRTLEIILYCCDNMSAIINNILDFSKMEAGKFFLDENEFDFYKMMDQVLATHIPVIHKKELHLSVYIDENIPQYVIGDSLRIGQILNNLLSNAVKFTLVGQVSVDVSKTMQVNDEVELFFMVRDTGIGISKEEQDKLFQSFKQVDASITRRFGGTGLGLSITKQLVEMMGGTVHVDSEKGKGSCFTFNIRLHTSQTVEERKELSEAYKKLINFAGEQDDREDYLTFGSEENRAELKKRMEKLVLSIELGSWDKAEALAETIKALLSGDPDEGMRRHILRLEMAIRKENYEKSIAAYEQVKAAVAAKMEEQ